MKDNSDNRILAVPDKLSKPLQGYNQSHIELCNQLLKSPNLRGWEKLFVNTLATSRNPGRKQLGKLGAIASRLNQDGGEA